MAKTIWALRLDDALDDQFSALPELDEALDEPLAEGASVAVGKSAPSRPPISLSFPQEPQAQASVPSSSSVVDAWMRLNRKSSPAMPWETGIFGDPFQSSLKKPSLAPPVFGMQAALLTHVEEPASSGSASSSTTQMLDFSRRRLRIARLIQTDDHARWEALRKLKTLVLINPASSELGRTLVAGAALLRSDSL